MNSADQFKVLMDIGPKGVEVLKLFTNHDLSVFDIAHIMRMELNEVADIMEKFVKHDLIQEAK